MHKGQKTTQSRGIQLKGLLVICFLSVLLLVAQPKAAHADPSDVPWLVAIFGSDTAIKIETVAHDAWDVSFHTLDAVYTHLQLAAQAMETALGPMLHLSGLGDFMDASDRNHHNSNASLLIGPTVLGHTMLKTTTTCPANEEMQQVNNVRLGVEAATLGTAAASAAGAAKGVGAATRAADLMEDISHGFRDCSSTSIYGDLLQQAPYNCPSSPVLVNGKSFVNRDVVPQSVVEIDQYSVPANVTANTNFTDMTMPSVQKLTDQSTIGEAEQNFIAAYSYCKRKRGAIAIQTSGKGRKAASGDAAAIEEGLDLMAGSGSGSYGLCIVEVWRRSAVGTAAASKSSVLKLMNQSQVAACQQMHTQGIISDTEWTACQSQGHERCEYGKPQSL